MNYNNHQNRLKVLLGRMVAIGCVVISFVTVSICVPTSCIEPKSEEEQLTDYIVEHAEQLNPQFNKIEQLITKYGKPDAFPSDTAIGNSGFEGTMARMVGTSANYQKIIKMLEADMKAYAVRESKNMDDNVAYGLENTLFYFCNDTVNQIQDEVLSDLPIGEKPFSSLSNREEMMDMIVYHRDFIYVHDFDKDIKSMIDWLTNLKYVVFVNYECALFPKNFFGDCVKGGIRAKADVYKLDDGKLFKSVKVYAESSESISGIFLKQSDLDRDIRSNLGKEVVFALWKQGMKRIERPKDDASVNY